nr:hypothetical protein [uncultured Chryseobacterium sp.]
MLKNESDRMDDMYTYKLNYLMMMSHLQSMETKPQVELTQLEKIFLEDIHKLEHEQMKPLHFRPRTHRGYIMKMTRRAERAFNPEKEKRINERKDTFEEEKKETLDRLKMENKLLTEEVSQFLGIEYRYISLIKAGIMLLQGNSRLAGIFPKSQSLTFNRFNKKNRHDDMLQHARKLLLENNLFREKNDDKQLNTGILLKDREGCICIMYIKEGHMKDSMGATFRPVFGASGAMPYGKYTFNKGEIEKRSYINMGLPDLSSTQYISYEKTATALGEYMKSRERLELKQPSLQSCLYLLQTPEYRANKIIEKKSEIEDTQLINQAMQNKIGMLENWMPSNCAEPAIMTAIYQMYRRSADIYLSVPFEGTLSKGELSLKYTCTRCALSEPAFMSPDTSDAGQRLTDMRLQRDRSTIISDHILSNGLTYSPEKRKKHPYLSKEDAIKRTVIRNQSHGFGHVKRGHDEVAVENTNSLLVVTELLEDMINQIPD